MRIEKMDKGDYVEFNIYEEIQTYQDIVQMKSSLHNQVSIKPDTKFKICIHDAFVIPSSIVGTLLELVEIYKSSLELYVKKEELYSSLKKLTLVEILNVKKF